MTDLKRRLDDVRSAYDAAAAELETAKRAREDAEQELGGNQVQVAIAVVSIQGLEVPPPPHRSVGIGEVMPDSIWGLFCFGGFRRRSRISKRKFRRRDLIWTRLRSVVSNFICILMFAV